MNLKHLTDTELDQSTKKASLRERMTTLEVCWHLRENERRMLFAKRGYRDLKEYCVKELKYSETSAWRRITTMKLLKDVPEVEEKIQNGNLNLSQASLAQSFFQQTKPDAEEKREILSSIENQSTKTTERILAEKTPDDIPPTRKPKPMPKEKAVKGNSLEVTMLLDEDFLNQLEEIEIFLNKKHSKLELFRLAAAQMLEKLRKDSQPKNQTQRKQKPNRHSKDASCSEQGHSAQPQRINDASIENVEMNKQVSFEDDAVNQPQKPGPASATATTSARRVSRKTIRVVKLRDENRCQYRDPLSGRQCEARHSLQLEHQIPFALGGGNDHENVQLLCRAHNQLRAVEQFGREKMKEFIPSLE